MLCKLSFWRNAVYNPVFAVALTNLSTDKSGSNGGTLAQQHNTEPKVPASFENKVS